jgi:hypothetical protein
MSRSNAVRAGFTSIFRDPAVFAAELAWRWAFAITAWLLIAYALLMFLQSLTVTDSDYLGLLGIFPGTIRAALESIFHGSGPKLVRLAVSLWFGLTLLWWFAASAGRTATLNALMPGAAVRLKDMLGIHALRAGLAAMAVLAYLGAIAAAAAFSQEPGGRDDTWFYLVAMPLLIIVSMVWSTLAWYLAIAPIVAAERGVGAVESFVEAAALAKRQPAQFTWVGFFYGGLRYLAAIFSFFVLIVMLSATVELPAGSGWVALLMWAAAFSFVSTLIGTARLAALVRIVRWDAGSV